MKSLALFKGEIITKVWNYIYEIKKSSSPEPMSQFQPISAQIILCLLYTSDAADDMQCVDLGGRRIIKKKKKKIFFKQKTAYEM